MIGIGVGAQFVTDVVLPPAEPDRVWSHTFPDRYDRPYGGLKDDEWSDARVVVWMTADADLEIEFTLTEYLFAQTGSCPSAPMYEVEKLP